MKVFCSYAFTGEDEAAVAVRMKKVVEVLQGNGHEAYCDLFDKHMSQLLAKNDVKAILIDAFAHLADCDAVVAIVTSPRRSIGQSMELGVALNDGKPIHLFEHESARYSTYLEKVSDTHAVWVSEDDLMAQLREI